MRGQTIRLSDYPSHNPAALIPYLLKRNIDTLIIDSPTNTLEIGPIDITEVKNRVIVLKEGLTIYAKRGGFPHIKDVLLRFRDCENVQLLGHGNRLIMRKNEYVDGEWRHGVSIRGGNNITLRNFQIESSGGDGVYLDGSNKKEYTENVFINEVTSHNNKRQGISIISAKAVIVEHSVFSGTIGTKPAAGIDLEPDNENQRIQEVKFRNCLIENNFNAGIQIGLGKLTGNSLPVDVIFEKCVLRNNQSVNNPQVRAEILIGAHKTNPVLGEVVFRECLVQGSDVGLLYSRKVAGAYKVVFENCAAIRINKDTTMPVLLLEVPDYFKGDFVLGGFEFHNLYVHSDNFTKVLMVRGSKLGTLKGIKDISGSLTIEAPEMLNMEFINIIPGVKDTVGLKMNRKPYTPRNP